MSKIITIILTAIFLTSCVSIKKNIDSNYKSHSEYRSNNYKKVK